MKLRMTEQADKTGDKVTYHWLLDAPYQWRKRLPAWKWAKGAGCRGAYYTFDVSEVERVAALFNLTIVSNGTHAVHNVPMFLTQKPIVLGGDA